MKKTVTSLALALTAFMSAYAADDFGTAKDAETMVANVVKAIASNKDGTYKEITGKDKKWIWMDIYPTVYGMDGICLAHGQNEKTVGKNLTDMVDVDGKEYMKERLMLAKTKGKFWQDYKFRDPITKKIMPKSMYCEKASDVLVCAGIYKR